MAAAQEAPPPVPPGPCEAGKVAAYEGERKARVYLRRRGAAVEVNPLRPLTRTPLVAVELLVDGRVAYAAGPDLAHLRRTGGLAEIEAEEPVTWAAEAGPPPAALRLVLEDGRAPFGALAFAGCLDAPAPAARRPARTGGGQDASPGRAGRPAGEGPGPRTSGPGPRLPQGAIPEGRTNLRE